VGDSNRSLRRPEGRKRGHGCPRQQAQAGWRARTGCERPEAESPYLQKFHAVSNVGDSNRSLRRPEGRKRGHGCPRQQAQAGNTKQKDLSMDKPKIYLETTMFSFYYGQETSPEYIQV
jgi:hypothetical protein